MYAVIRIRGRIGKNKKAEDTLKNLGLKINHSMTVLNEKDISLIKKISSFVTWGELSKDIAKKIGDKKIVYLNSPKKGFKSIKMTYPRGDLGYRGEKINELIERMSK